MKNNFPTVSPSEYLPAGGKREKERDSRTDREKYERRNLELNKKTVKTLKHNTIYVSWGLR